MEFNFENTKEQNHNVISLSGRLIDKTDADELLKDIEKSINGEQQNFIFDFNDLEYMNSNGLNTMVNILTKSRSNGGEIVITNLSQKVNQLLVITKLNTVFTVANNYDEAVQILEQDHSKN